jgi:hypothetical protein
MGAAYRKAAVDNSCPFIPVNDKFCFEDFYADHGKPVMQRNAESGFFRNPARVHWELVDILRIAT